MRRVLRRFVLTFMQDEGVKNAFGGTAVNAETMHRGPAAGQDLNRE